MSSTLGTWLDEAVEQAGRRGRVSTLLVDDMDYTSVELAQDSRQLAGGLAGLGLRPGERVCVLMRASVPALQVWFALARAGLVEVPINVDSGEALLGYYLQHSGARTVVCDADLVERVLRVRPSGLDHLIVSSPAGEADDRGGEEGSSPDAGQVQVIDLAALFTDAGYGVGPRPEDPSVILYTSGTTGPPKGAVLSHRANVNLARHTVSLMGYTEQDRLFSVFPLFHSNARFCSVMAAIEAGADLVLHRRFSASRFWQICREHQITAFNYQGAMLGILYQLPPRDDDHLNPVRVGFGAPCPAEIFTAFEKRFGVTLTEIYGSTEVSIVTDMPPERRRIGTAGTESANYQVAIVDQHDQPVPTGTAGEIVVRSKRPGWMFDGYHAMPAETVASWRNLWFHTGDRGRLDPDGFLTFLDRMKDTVRRRGENISTWEVERVALTFPAVAEAAAYGVPSELSEEEVMLAVVPADDATVDPAVLIEHCRLTLTPFAVPRFVRVLDELPKTPSQRVRKYLLREEGIVPGCFDRGSGAPAPRSPVGSESGSPVVPSAESRAEPS
ncbi:MAG: AMP-binding protein [Actinomycetales bacterium]